MLTSARAVLGLAVSILPVWILAVLVPAILPWLSIAILRARHCFKLTAQALHLTECCCLVSLALAVLPCALLSSGVSLPRCLGRILQLLAQLRKPLRNLALCAIRVGVHACAQPVGGTLNMIVQVGLIHFAESIAQFLGHVGLIGCDLASGLT